MKKNNSTCKDLSLVLISMSISVLFEYLLTIFGFKNNLCNLYFGLLFLVLGGTIYLKMTRE